MKKWRVILALGAVALPLAVVAAPVAVQDYTNFWKFITQSATATGPFSTSDWVPLIRGNQTFRMEASGVGGMARDASNAILPDARVNILSSVGWVESNQGLEPGYDWTSSCAGYNCGQFWLQLPSTQAQAVQRPLRLQRSASYTNDHPTLSAGGTGATATVTFSGFTDVNSTTIPIGHTVIIAGMSPAGYNGTYTVTGSAPGSISFANATTGPQTVAGTVFDSTDANGKVVNDFWALDYTSATGAYYEWTILGELHNRSGGIAAHAPQNVAINGTVFKEFDPAHTYGTDQIAPSWGGNFACDDRTGTVNPAYGCVGIEIDNFVIPGAGTDTNEQRVILQLQGGHGQAGDHISRGITIGIENGMIIDKGIELTGAAATNFGVGLDFRGSGIFSTAAILGKASDQMAIGWTDTAGLYDATHGVSIETANDDKFYVTNMSDTEIILRGPGGATRMSVGPTDILIGKHVSMPDLISAANCAGQPTGMIISITGTGVLTQCP